MVSFDQIKNVIHRCSRSYQRLNSGQISEDFVKKMKSPGRLNIKTENRVHRTEYRARITMTIAYDLRSKLKKNYVNSTILTEVMI